MSDVVLIYDNGLFVSWAERLTEYFDRVLYYNPCKNAFPKSNSRLVGTGIEGVEKVTDFWDVVDDVDLFIFPDVYDGDLQNELRRQGKRVWGSGKGEEIELHRWETKQLLARMGLPVQPVVKIVGLEALRDHLKSVDGKKWIKVSWTRGDMETWEHESYDLSEPRLDELENKLGAKKKVIEFIVEDDIPDAVEVAYDGY